MTEDYPATILEFEQRCATDAACRAYLMALRWPEGLCVSALRRVQSVGDCA